MLKLKNVSQAKMIISRDAHGKHEALAPGECIEITNLNSDLCKHLSEKYPMNFSLVDENALKEKPKFPEQAPLSPVAVAVMAGVAGAAAAVAAQPLEHKEKKDKK